MSTTIYQISDAERGPRLPDGEFMFNQERLERDFALTQRIQAGYIPAEPTGENPHPKIVDGDLDDDAAQALNELWGHYEPAAQKSVSEMRGLVDKIPSIDEGDLLGEAFLGFYHSSLRWKPRAGDKPVTFLTHARSMMRNYMQGFIDDTATAVRLPRGLRQDVRRLNRTLWKMYGARERLPFRQAVGEAMGLNAAEVDRLAATEALTHQMGSIDVGYFEDDRDKHSIYGKRPDSEVTWKPIDPSAEEQRRVDDEVLQTGIASYVRETLGGMGLDSTDLAVLRIRFFGDKSDGMPLTLQETAEELSKLTGRKFSRERIRQIEARVLAKLRQADAKGETSLYDYFYGEE